ncbi:MAG TPA: Ig-like domain-containing protein [Candidatus Saccharimonadales bacterium]|nr:Ig-like domain-containing protein [Candidatus Saccharimonadales bacterium]
MALLGLELLAPPWVQAGGSPDIIWQQSLNSDRINSVAFSPDGSTLISGSSDRLINIWNASDGTLEKVLNSGAPDVHPSSVECVAIDPAAPNLIASVNAEWSPLGIDAEHFWRLPAGTEENLSAPSPTNWMVWCAFSPNGQYFAAACFNQQVRVWKVASPDSVYKTFTTSAVQRTVAFSPDGKWMASAGGDDVVTVRNTSNWAVAATLTGHSDTIYDLAFSPDGTMIASGSYDLTARIWNVDGWSLRYTLGNNNGSPGSDLINGVTFSPDSKTLAYADPTAIYLVDTGTGQVYQKYDQNTDDIQCMAFSSQGTLAYGVVDRTVYVANVLGGTTLPDPPSVALTSPGNGSSFYAPATVTLTAAATSPNGVAEVTYYDQNNNNLGTATNAPYSVVQSEVAAGNYTVTAVMQDNSGATANSASVSFTVIPAPIATTGPLAVSTSGTGRILPNRGSANLKFGARYLIEAVPGAGYVFNGWTTPSGSTVTNAANFYFTMEAGLALQADFIPNPFIPVDGIYYGLQESSPPTLEGAGRTTVNVSSSGTFTASFYFGTVLYTLSGRFDNNGNFSRSISRTRNTPLAVTLALDVNGSSEQITGTVSDGNITSILTADRQKWNARTNKAPAGNYTILIPPDPSQSSTPQGYGVALVSIATSGAVTVSGRLADGVAFTGATYLSKNLTWPLFALVNGAHESLFGEITLENESGSDINGTVSWFRQAINKSAYYPSGFETQVSLIGSLYAKPPTVAAPLTVPQAADNATVSLSGVDFASPATFMGQLNTRFQFITDKSSGSPGNFALGLNRNGYFSGSFIDPNTRKGAPFLGIIFQKQNIGLGTFLSAGQSGSIQLAPSQ